MSFFSVRHISKKEGKNQHLEDISFTQEQFQKIAVAGETGSGKSTLLKIIAGLIQPDTGSVHLEGEKVYGPEEQLVAGHPEIAYLSQHFELPAFLRVEQVLRYANTFTPDEAEALYQICQIVPLLHRRTDELSGGEKQRIALARLLSTSPSLLLLDEPFSNLDLAHKNALKTVIKDIGENLGITCILVSHDPLDTLSWADKILVMRQGKLIQEGPPEFLYRQPLNEYVAGLFGTYTLLTGPLLQALSTGKTAAPEGVPQYVRPESFQIKEEGKGIKGKVTSTRFFGGYSEADILVGETTMVVRTGKTPLTPRQKVYLTLGSAD